jgi:hypothetical protein
VATMHGAQLEGYLNDKIPKPVVELDAKDGDKDIKVVNLAYEDWRVADQHVINFLLASVSKDVLAQIAMKETTVEAWQAIDAMFLLQTRARAVNTRLALSTVCKGNMTMAEYIGRMHSLGDGMAATGIPLDDDELFEYILTGLDEEYASLVSSVLAHLDPISVGEVYSPMLAFETRIDLHNKNNSSGSSANAVSRGRGRGGPVRSCYGGNHGGRGSNSPA